MKKAAMFLAGLCFTLTVTAQEQKERVEGNGHNAKEKREVGADYTKVKVNGNFEVALTSGEAGTLTLEGEDNLLSRITTEVKDGILTIDAGNSFLVPSRNRKLSVRVPVGLLSEISMKGSGTINVKNTVKGNLKVLLDGPGQIDVSVNAQTVQAWVLGSGEIKIDGRAENFDCRVVGSGAVKAYDLKAPNVSALVSGSGNVEANSSKSLKGRISGSGNIAFAGEPAKTDLMHSGTGKFSYYHP